MGPSLPDVVPEDSGLRFGGGGPRQPLAATILCAVSISSTVQP